MKRFLMVFMVLGLVVGSVATAEAKKRPRRVERTVETSYECDPAVGFPPVCSGQYGERVETRAKEAFFTAEVIDAHGQPIYVDVYEDHPDFPGLTGRLVGSFCGKTSEPISFRPGADLTFSSDIYINMPPPSCPTGRLATNGTTSVTLSNLP